MTITNNSSQPSNLLGKIKKKFQLSKTENTNLSNLGSSPKNNFLFSHPHSPYYSAGLSNILFLSKRGLSRAPLAREIMREMLYSSEHFGSIRPSARGTSDAYELCAFDKRMVYCARKFGYQLSGASRMVNMSELSSTNLIITLDQESESFTNSQKAYIYGEVLPIASFLPTGSLPYIADPFERDDSIQTNSIYKEIILSLELACKNLLDSVPAIVFQVS